MLFEDLQKIYGSLLLVSPFLAVALIIVGYIYEGKRSTQALLGAIGMGLLGVFVIQPIDPGPWGWGIIAYFFVFPYWFSIAYLLWWAFFALSNQPRKTKLGSILLLVSILLIATSNLNIGYTKTVKRDAYRSIRAYLNGNLSQETLEAEGFDKTKIFKSEVVHFLHYDSDKLSASQIRFLAAKGFNIYKSASCPRDLMDTALSFNNKSNAGTGLPRYSLNSLAENPSISEEDFIKLAGLEDDDIFRALIVNISTNEHRYAILRPILVETIEALPKNDNYSWQRNRFINQLKHLDRERKRRIDQQDRL